jgi:hypothetical protein
VAARALEHGGARPDGEHGAAGVVDLLDEGGVRREQVAEGGGDRGARLGLPPDVRGAVTGVASDDVHAAARRGLLARAAEPEREERAREPVRRARVEDEVEVTLPRQACAAA